MSYAPEVRVEDYWVGNELRFATHDEAEQYAYSIEAAWPLAYDTRVVETFDPINARIENDTLVPLLH